MVAQGRKNRYIATARSDGFFEVQSVADIQDTSKSRQLATQAIPLYLCLHCKTILKDHDLYNEPFVLKQYYKQFEQAQSILGEHSLQQFTESIGTIST